MQGSQNVLDGAMSYRFVHFLKLNLKQCCLLGGLLIMSLKIVFIYMPFFLTILLTFMEKKGNQSIKILPTPGVPNIT